MTEIWLPVKGFEGRYEVSSKGRVRSVNHYDKRGRFYEGKILKPQIACGYLQVYFRVGNKQRWYKVHTLVAEAFLPVPPYLYILIENGEGRLEINHKDENKLNNSVENIEWCTSSYNKRWSNRNVVKKGKTKEEIKTYMKEYHRKYYLAHREQIKEKNLKKYYTNKK